MTRWIAMLSLCLCVIATSASAQSVGQIINRVERFVHSTMAKATRSRWNKRPRAESACVEQKLQERGDSLEALMKRGVYPNDSRVAKVRSHCQADSARQSFQRIKDQAYKRSGRDTLIATSDYKNCETLCRDSDSCAALTYFRTEKICRLMSLVTELKPDDGADSAFRNEPITGAPPKREAHE